MLFITKKNKTEISIDFFFVGKNTIPHEVMGNILVPITF